MVAPLRCAAHGTLRWGNHGAVAWLGAVGCGRRPQPRDGGKEPAGGREAMERVQMQGWPRSAPLVRLPAGPAQRAEFIVGGVAGPGNRTPTPLSPAVAPDDPHEGARPDFDVGHVCPTYGLLKNANSFKTRLDSIVGFMRLLAAIPS